MKTPPPWRIGELAAATGLTVRTLHHYEQLGLLSPARSDGEHRLYDRDDVERLYAVRALAELGLGLREIGLVLDGAVQDLPDLLRRHRAKVEEELARREAQLAGLDAALAQPDAATLMGVVEASSRVAAHAAARRSAPRAGERWRVRGQRLRVLMEEGADPASAAVRAVATEIRIAIVAFSDGDERVLDALAQLRRQAPPASLVGWDPPLFAFLDAALTALEDPC
ncbi:MAG: MerR family transcriptional regulator [Alphaproteobacteria bacterium]|nr:MerR family transcriptional regulator [Alphaproteobacteria bacterium]